MERVLESVATKPDKEVGRLDMLAVSELTTPPSSLQSAEYSSEEIVGPEKIGNRQ
jgi:hypothetical protein